MKESEGLNKGCSSSLTNDLTINLEILRRGSRWSSARKSAMYFLEYFLSDNARGNTFSCGDYYCISIIAEYFYKHYFREIDEGGSSVEDEMTSVLMEYGFVIDRFVCDYGQKNSQSKTNVELESHFKNAQTAFIMLALERLKKNSIQNASQTEREWEIRSSIWFLVTLLLPSYSRVGKYLSRSGSIETCPSCQSDFCVLSHEVYCNEEPSINYTKLEDELEDLFPN